MNSDSATKNKPYLFENNFYKKMLTLIMITIIICDIK